MVVGACAGPLLAPKEFGAARKGLLSGRLLSSMSVARSDLDVGSVADPRPVKGGARGVDACRRPSGARRRRACRVAALAWSSVNTEVVIDDEGKARVASFKRLEKHSTLQRSRAAARPRWCRRPALVCPRRRDIPPLRARRAERRAECWRDRASMLASVVAAPGGVLSPRSSMAMVPAGGGVTRLGCRAALAKVATLRVRPRYGAPPRDPGSDAAGARVASDDASRRSDGEQELWNVGGSGCVGVPAERQRDAA